MAEFDVATSTREGMGLESLAGEPVNTHSAKLFLRCSGIQISWPKVERLEFGLRHVYFIRTTRSSAISMVCSKASTLSFIGVLVQTELKHKSWPRINIL